VIETLPYRWYSDPERLRLEQERVFARSWQYAGRAAEVAEPGSFLSADCAGVPVVVVRDRDGVLRAFLNVCRHRGAVLLEGSGVRQTIQCPYHAWTYALDGTLRAAPRSEREPGFEPEELSLRPVSVEAWGPFLFVNPDAGAAPLAEALGALPELLARDVDLGALRFHSRVRSELRANWKVAAENFLECYHCPTVHPAFAEAVETHPDRYELEPHPTFAAQSCTARGTGETGQFHLLYPNTGINVFPGPPNLSIGPILPDGPERTIRTLDYFFATDADPDWIDEFLAYDDQIGREDTTLVESVHRGMRSGLVDHGRLLAESEQLIASFQGWLLARLAAS
jgi:choline monooxygenase